MGIQKDVLVWSFTDLSATPSVGSTFSVTGSPDLMAFHDDETTQVPSDFDPAVPSTIDANQTLSGTLEGVEFTGINGSDDVVEFEVAFQVTDGTNTFNIYQINNYYYGGTSAAYVSEMALDPDATYTVLAQDNSVNLDNGTGYETTPVWNDLAGHVDGTSGDDFIGAGYADDDDDRVDGNDGERDIIVGGGGNDTIISDMGDDLIYGDHVDDLPDFTMEYIAQGFVRDVNFELESGSLAFNDATVSVSGTPLEIRFIDNDPFVDGDNVMGESPDDPDQLVEINGVLYNYSNDYVIQMSGSDGVIYNMLVLDVDRDSSTVIDLYDPTSDPGDVDYENGQILIPRGDVPPPGVWLTEFGPTYDITNDPYSALNGGAEINNYDDVIDAGFGNDTVFGGQGNDSIDGGDGADAIDAGTGSDTIALADNYGADSIIGGEDPDGFDIDVLDASGVTTDGVDVTISSGEAGSVTSTQGVATFDNIESFILTDQEDTFNGNLSTSDLMVDGAGGDDVLRGGSANNTLLGGTGDDVFEIGYGIDSIEGGAGTDTLSIDSADDALNLFFGGDGFGTFSDSNGDSGSFIEIEAVEGSSGADTIDASNTTQGVSLVGGAGDDLVTGGSGGDTIEGGAGADTLTGGAGADTLTGGAGPDEFIVDAGGDIITDFDTSTGIGDGDSTDNDFVDLTQFYNATTLAAWNAANPGNQYASELGWLRADQEDGTLDQAGGLQVQNGGSAVAASGLNAENTGVVCFTKGTLIATEHGEIPIEDLVPGDLVQTLDHGLQPIRWIGARHLSLNDLLENPKIQPIRISPAVIGLPDVKQDLVVSPQHRILVTSKIAQRMLGEGEVLIAAKKLLGLEGVEVAREKSVVSYYHVLCDEHEILLANGIPAESLYLGKEALLSLSPEGLYEIRTLFPELDAEDFRPRSCRKIVSGSQAKSLCYRLAKNHRSLSDSGLQMSSRIAFNHSTTPPLNQYRHNWVIAQREHPPEYLQH